MGKKKNKKFKCNNCPVKDAYLNLLEKELKRLEEERVELIHRAELEKYRPPNLADLLTTEYLQTQIFNPNQGYQE